MSSAETPLPPADDRDRHLRTDDLINDLGRRTARGGAITHPQGTKFFLSTVATMILARLLSPGRVWTRRDGRGRYRIHSDIQRPWFVSCDDSED